MAKATIDTATQVEAAKGRYLETFAIMQAADAAGTAMWEAFTEAEIDAWTEEEFTHVAATIERECGIVPAAKAEREAAESLVAACRDHVRLCAKTRRQYRTHARTMELVFSKWNTVHTLRQRMIKLCLELDPRA